MMESIAYAEAPVAGAVSANPLLHPMFPLVLVFLVMYLFIIRPQQKRQQELQKVVANLKKGDRIVAAGGIIGTVSSIQDDYIVIKTDGENKIEVLKSSITGLRQ